MEAHSRLQEDYNEKKLEADNHFKSSIKPLGPEWKAKRERLSKEFNLPKGFGWRKDQALKALPTKRAWTLFHSIPNASSILYVRPIAHTIDGYAIIDKYASIVFARGAALSDEGCR